MSLSGHAEHEAGTMTLMEHLAELRRRVFAVVVSVVCFGGVSLFFAKDIFRFLMLPVLRALPRGIDGLVYTSAVEELSVYMKVGLYAGAVCATPVVLWQVWLFVAPGLYQDEKRLVGPFVFAGTAAFLAGTIFCYLVILPQMFSFLLSPPEARAAQVSLERDDSRERLLLLYLALGDAERAADVAGNASVSETVQPQTSELAVFRHDLSAFTKLIEALAVSRGGHREESLLAAAGQLAEANAAAAKGDTEAGISALKELRERLTGGGDAGGGHLVPVLGFLHDLSLRRAAMEEQLWTRPMLSMNEQLSLVLVLEVAFGVIFELPLVMALLAAVGIVKFRWLWKYQRHAVVVCLIVAAIATPTGDAVNLALMAGPLFACYEVGMLLVWFVERRRERRLAVA